MTPTPYRRPATPQRPHSGIPLTILAPNLQYCSHVREPHDVGHSRPISGGPCYHGVTLVTIIESYSYATVTSNSLATPAPRRTPLGIAMCDFVGSPYVVEPKGVKSRHDGISRIIYKATPASFSASPTPYHDRIAMKTKTLLCNAL
jgi:hypothetical protein